MKKLLTLGFAALFLASCSNDDGDSSYEASQLQKKWYFVSTTIAGQTFPYDDHEACGKDYIEFLSNMTYRTVDVWECEEYAETGSWSLMDGNMLMVDGDEATIKSLNATNMTLTLKYDYDDDGDIDTITEKLTSVE